MKDCRSMENMYCIMRRHLCSKRRKYEEDDIGETFYLSEEMPCEDFGIVVEAWRPLPEPYKESENG